MKQIIIFIIGLLASMSSLFSQISVNQSDMPLVGDTLRVSLTNVVPAGFAKSAMDTSWNYSALEALSQRVDTFMSVTATPSAYQLFFVLMGGANLASPRGNSPIPGLPVTQGFTFYKNSSTSYSDLGSAYTVQQFPLPAKYDIPDKLYQFPMTPGLTWASTSSFSVDVPDLAYYSTQRIRSNIVDGWGNLTTPYGTFQTLRVKSTLIMHDSLYIDSLGTGFPFVRNIIEYKWLAKGKGIPVLQISAEGNMVTATYRDIYRMSAQPLTASLGADTAVPKGTVLTIHATVSGGTPPYQILWNTLDTGHTLTVNVQDIQTYSILVIDALQNFGMAQKIVSILYPPGIEETASVPLKVYPNPAGEKIHFTLPLTADYLPMEVISCLGQTVLTTTASQVAGEYQANLSSLPDGIYLILIHTKNQVYKARLQIVR